MVAGIAALFLIFLMVPTDFSQRNDYTKSLVQDHLMHNYSEDLESIEDLDVWLANQNVFNGPIPREIMGTGNYQILGGRICYIDDCRTIHLVYRNQEQLISLYISDASEVDIKLAEQKSYSHSYNSYDIKLWKEAGHLYAVVI